ncbi:class II lanthipeptide, LchA2/BrtA2 family [Bacillus sp. ISL-51]|uniref:class II lanthipeptide, LchA2/BrtA2 family n=1 Tax=Bacteria TaxID=2 RepID=UPI001BE9C275|nr:MULTISPECIES: class II lanthipeptide, LchA2/BrtA2 family [Bacteria]MBT2573728.1 class II lanthipeptide, LchA2/BrtA2 family [Bacillus sp. ISL-51]MBT2634941.1 class II lanthipeptide, LchA2/BrtA2 family [Bacillus sp. ISL-26]MBT2712416.1 class II lanthipeptide, LchA2/BrtA2 family [Pseudomonas sp. ISL-88]
MKKEFLALEQMTEEELKELAGGSEATPMTITPTTITIPISLAGCPTTKCASIVSPCND